MLLTPNHEMLSLFAPEIPELLVRRFRILRKLFYDAPIGRRSLAAYFQVGERLLRREIELLRNQGLIFVEARGISLTPSGESLVL